MSEIENLLNGYEQTISLPWEHNLAGPQKVWIAIYEPSQERRLRFRVADFEVITKKAGYSWVHLDITDAFANWMAHNDYREEYFHNPDDLDLALPEFAAHVADQVRKILADARADARTVVALSGLASLFGLTRASELIEDIAPSIKGRLLVFFPGHQEGSNRRLLDARDGWNYLALSITASKGA